VTLHVHLEQVDARDAVLAGHLVERPELHLVHARDLVARGPERLFVE
jgi:hypothetical protein